MLFSLLVLRLVCHSCLTWVILQSYPPMKINVILVANRKQAILRAQMEVNGDTVLAALANEKLSHFSLVKARP